MLLAQNTLPWCWGVARAFLRCCKGWLLGYSLRHDQTPNMWFLHKQDYKRDYFFCFIKLWKKHIWSLRKVIAHISFTSVVHNLRYQRKKKNVTFPNSMNSNWMHSWVSGVPWGPKTPLMAQSFSFHFIARRNYSVISHPLLLGRVNTSDPRRVCFFRMHFFGGILIVSPLSIWVCDSEKMSCLPFRIKVHHTTKPWGMWNK